MKLLLIFFPFIILCFSSCSKSTKQSYKEQQSIKKYFSEHIYKPVTNNGKKWRIAYYQGGNYFEYSDYLRNILKSLFILKWIDYLPYLGDSEEKSAEAQWNLVAKEIESRYIEFVSDGFWSADWNKSKRKSLKEDILKRLKKKKDIDLIIAMGTWASMDLCAYKDSNTAVILTGLADPEKSGIIKNVKESKQKNIHFLYDPQRYEKQIRLFKLLTGFKKLGVAFENTKIGSVYADIEDIERLSKELDFEPVYCFAKESGLTAEKSADNIKKCYKKLSEKVDALWIQVHLGETPQYIYDALIPIYKRKIPTWSKLGEHLVRYGALLSLADNDKKDIAMYEAKIISAVFNGVSCADIPTYYECSDKIAINKKIAEKIDFQVPERYKYKVAKKLDYIEVYIK